MTPESSGNRSRYSRWVGRLAAPDPPFELEGQQAAEQPGSRRTRAGGIGQEGGQLGAIIGTQRFLESVAHGLDPNQVDPRHGLLFGP